MTRLQTNTVVLRRRAQSLGLLVAGARAVLGVVALAAPGVVARPWIGEDPTGLATAVLGRALGGRDLALGLGALAARRDRAGLRRWVLAGALADAGDVATTVATFPRLAPRGRAVVLASAGSALAAGIAAAALA